MGFIPPRPKGVLMERATPDHLIPDRSELLVHDWRLWQLERLGIPVSLGEVYADRVDWHQVARLVQHGCPPRLALRIVS
jgi:hypothetical protein